MSDLEGDAELIEDFVVEGREALDIVDESLLALESNPSDIELVREIFRRVHSVKGAAGFLGFDMVEGLSHAGESLLSRVREGELPFTEEIATALLGMVDSLRSIFDTLERTGSEGPNIYAELLRTLIALREGTSGGADTAPPEANVDVAATSDPDEPEAAIHEAEVEAQAVTGEPSAEPTNDATSVTHLANPIAGKERIGQILLRGGVITEVQLNEVLALQQAGDERRLGDILTELGYVNQGDIEKLIHDYLANLGLDQKPTTDEPASKKGPAESSIRVDIDLLDGIVGLVGELVLTRNQIVQSTEDGVTDMGRRTQELAYITSSLQEQALRTRMQRIENAWRSLPRVVRDVAKITEKSATLEMTGEGIELDRTIIEAIRDPLVHLVRNAVDHGLETPDVRRAAGKPEKGTIHLSAIQEGGHVIIEVADDGAGIDPHRIAASAVEKELVSADDVANMTDAQKTSLILQAGFSTASEVTKISGRGVGMDVVASNLKEIRGSIEIQSELGVGTSIRLAIPLTLAIVPALVVTCSDQLFAVPQASVLELVRLQGSDLTDRIEWLHNAPVLRLREQLLPLIELTDVLEMAENPDRAAATIIVVQSGDQPFGMIVDQVTKAEEIVVKPVSRQIQSVGVYAGATVMGDGSAALILDVSAIARGSNLSVAAPGATEQATTEVDHLEPVLTVTVGDRRAGLPTSELERLEKVDAAAVEWTGDSAVVQYRGRLLPLVFLSQILDHRPTEIDDRPLRVVVTSEQADTSVGLVVDQVLDVLDIDPETTDRIGRDGRLGVIGSVVAAGSVIELLDVPALIHTVDAGPIEVPDNPDPSANPDSFVGSAA